MHMCLSFAIAAKEQTTLHSRCSRNFTSLRPLLAAPSTEVARKQKCCAPKRPGLAHLKSRLLPSFAASTLQRCGTDFHRTLALPPPANTTSLDHVLLAETCRQRGLVSHLKSGPLPSLAASTSHRCRTGCLSDAGVAATRSAKYPTGHRCFSSWKPGWMYSMRPSSSTVGAHESTAHSRCNRHSLLFFEAPGRRFSASRRHILKGIQGSG